MLCVENRTNWKWNQSNTYVNNVRKGLVYIDNDQSSIKQAIDDKISDIAAGTDGIEGLRLPTLEELKYIKDNVDAINDNLDNLGKSRFLIGSGTLYSYYF